MERTRVLHPLRLVIARLVALPRLIQLTGRASNGFRIFDRRAGLVLQCSRPQTD
jgi:hypothetical protein